MNREGQNKVLYVTQRISQLVCGLIETSESQEA